jgi:hypothetical protein
MAAEVRQLAEQVALPEVRRELLDLAERFERLARWAEGRENQS